MSDDRPVLSLVGRTYPDECRADALKLLEEWKGRVERGELVAIAIAGIDQAGYSYTAYSKTSLVSPMVGGLFALMRRLTD